MDLGTAVGAIELIYQGGPAVQQAQADLQGLEKGGLAAGAAQAAMGAGLAAGGKQVLDFLGDSVGKAAAVQETLLAVQAATGATTDEVQTLDKVIGQLGSDTVFSTQEVADASLIMARAGIDASDQAGGALKTVTDLAAATGEGLESSANLVSNTQAIFGLSTDEITKVADLHTQAMNSSRVGLTEYEAGVRNLGPVLAGYAQTQEEVDQALLDTAASTAFLTAAGLKGADAGLSTARMLENIATPSTEDYANALREAGITVFDAEGNFKGLPAIIEDVNQAMSGLTDEQKAQKLDEWGIGQEALDVLNTFANQGDKYNQFVEDMLAGNNAAESAGIMMQGLNGALEGLGGTFEEIQRQVGSTFLAPLEAVVRAIDEVASAFLQLPPGVQSAIAAIAGIAGVVMTAVGAFIAAQGAIQGFNALLSAGGVAKGIGAATALGVALGVIAVAAAAIVAYQTNFLGFRDAVQAAGKAIQKFGSELKNAFATNKAAGLNDLAAALGAIGVALDNTFGTDLFPFFQEATLAVQAFGDAWQAALDAGMNPAVAGLDALAAAASSLGLDEISTQLQSASEAVRRFGDEFASAFEANKAEGMSGAAAAISAIGDALSEVLGVDVSGLFDAIAGGIEAAIPVIQNFLGALGQLKDAFMELMGAQLANVGETLMGIGAGLRDAFTSLLNGDLAGAFTGLGDAIGSALRGSLDMLGNFGGFIRDQLSQIDWGGIASAIGSGISGALQGIGDFITGLDGGAILQSISDALMAAFNAAGDALGPVAASIGSALTTALNGIGDFLGGLNFDQIKNDVVTLIQNAFTGIDSLLTGVAEGVGAALGSALGTIGNFLGEINFGDLASQVMNAITAAFTGGGELSGSGDIAGNGNLFSNIAQSIGGALGQALSTVGQFLGELNFGDLVSTVSNAISSAFGGGGDAQAGLGGTGTSGGFSGIAQSIGQALGTALQTIGDFIGELNLTETVTGIIDQIQAAFDAGGQFDFSQLGEDIKGALEEACGVDLSGVFDKLGAAVNKATSAFSAFGQHVGTALGNARAALDEIDFSGAQEAFDNLGTALNTLKDALGGAISKKIEDISAALAAIELPDLGETMASIAAGFNSLRDAVGGAISSKIEDISAALAAIDLPDLAGVLDGISGAISAIGAAAGGAIQNVKDFFAALPTNADDPYSVENLTTPGVSPLMQALGGESDQAEQALAMGGDFATNFINNVAASFASADYSPIVNAMNAGLASVLSGGGQAQLSGSGDIAGSSGTSIGTTFVQGLITDIAAAFTPEAFAPIQTAFTTAFNTLQTTLDTAVSGVQTSLQAIIPAISGIAAAAAVAIGGMNTSITSAFTTLQASVDTAVSGIQASIQAIIPAIQQIASGVALAIGTMNTSITSAFQTLQASVDTAISGIQTSIQAIIPAIQSIATEVGTAIGQMSTTIQTAFSEMQSAVDTAVSGIQTSVQAIIPALNSVAAEAGAAAGSIGDAIVAALDADLEAVRSSAAALGAAATVPIQSAIQPGSPSRVVMPWAESVPEAITTAYEDGMGPVQDASAALGEAATDGVIESAEGVIKSAQDLMDRSLVIFEDGSSKWMTEAEKAEWFGTALEDSATPAVEEGMTSMIQSGADAAASALESARALFEQYGLTFGNDLTQGAATGVAEGATAAAEGVTSLYDRIISQVQERLGGLWKGPNSSPSWMGQAEELMRQRNPWAADLMRDQEMTFNFEATLDGQKMSDWTVRETLGGMLGVRDRGGMKRGMKA